MASDGFPLPTRAARRVIHDEAGNELPRWFFAPQGAEPRPVAPRPVLSIQPRDFDDDMLQLSDDPEDDVAASPSGSHHRKSNSPSSHETETSSTGFSDPDIVRYSQI